MPDHITPTIGRIVWYRGKDGKVRAAIVTHVWSEFLVNLHAFGHDSNDTETGSHTSVTHGDIEQEKGCCPSWSWMPYQVGQAKAQAAVENTESLPPASAVKGPTVTGVQIDALFHTAKFTDAKLGEKSTVVCAKLANGFEIIESSGCVDPANYSHALGVDICKKRIAERLWQLEGYALQVALSKA